MDYTDYTSASADRANQRIDELEKQVHALREALALLADHLFVHENISRLTQETINNMLYPKPDKKKDIPHIEKHARMLEKMLRNKRY